MDKFGQEFETRNSNWEDFKLNNDTYELVKKIIVTNKIPQEVGYEILKSGHKIKDGFL